MASGLGSVNIANLVSNWSLGRICGINDNADASSNSSEHYSWSTSDCEFHCRADGSDWNANAADSDGRSVADCSNRCKLGRNRVAVFPIGQRYWQHSRSRWLDQRPAGWRLQCHRLLPGRHSITAAVNPPVSRSQLTPSRARPCLPCLHSIQMAIS